MATIERLRALPENGWMARFAPAGLAWWVVRSGAPGPSHGSPGAAAAATAALISQNRGLTEHWLARVEGTRAGVRYAVQTIPAAGHRVIGDRHGSWAVITALDTTGALAVLDATETVDIGVVLTGCAEGAPPGDALLDGVPIALGDGGLDLMVMRPRGAPWFVVGSPDRAPELNLAALAVVAEGELPVAGDPRRRAAWTGTRRREAAAVAVGAALAVAIGAVSLWRLGHHGVVTAAHPPPTGHVAARCFPAPMSPGGQPTSTGGPSIAADDEPGRQRVVLFGGAGDGASTWLWSGQTWSLARPATSPPARENAAIAYDPPTRGLLMFGGERTGGLTATARLDDTWRWDNCTWTLLAAHLPQGASESAPAMAWDQRTNQMVLVTSAGTVSTETWTWSGSRWSLAAAARESPTGQRVVMGFDPVVSGLIAVTVGGDRTSGSSTATTWWWDGHRWAELKTPHSPLLSSSSVLTLDPTRNLLLLAEPSRSGSTKGAVTWEWDGGDWVALQSGAQRPIPAAVVGDPSAGVVEMFGWTALGPRASPVLDVWAWSDNAWLRLADGSAGVTISGASPAPRQVAETANDPVRGQLVLFGGNGTGLAAPPAPSTPLLDTWSFDGSRWRQWPSAPRPSTDGPMAFDPRSGTVLMVAAPVAGQPSGATQPSRTWSWDGSHWRPLHATRELPPVVGVVAMIADPVSRTMLAVASCCADLPGPTTALQTWSWDGQAWTPLRAELPADLSFVMAWDPLSERVLAVGSEDGVGPATTWAWNGRAWVALAARGAVFDPVTATIATDLDNGTIVLVTTVDGIVHTEVWNGRAWADAGGIGPAGAALGYGSAAMYYDYAGGRLLLLSSSSEDFNQEWFWTGAAWLQLAPQGG